MRCYSCNNILTTQESVRRFKGSGDFVDLCNHCLSTISEDVDTVDGQAGVEGDKDENPDECGQGSCLKLALLRGEQARRGSRSSR